MFYFLPIFPPSFVVLWGCVVSFGQSPLYLSLAMDALLISSHFRLTVLTDPIARGYTASQARNRIPH